MALSAKDQAEVIRKAQAGIALAGDGKGNVSKAALDLWQQTVTAAAASKVTDTSNQQSGSGVGTTSTTSVGVGNATVPNVTNSVVTNWGFTAIVGLGAVFVLTAVLSAFKRSRR